MRFKPLIIIFVLILVIFSSVIIFLQQKKPTIPVEKGKELKIEISSKAMRLASSAFGHNQPIPSKYTCDGDNINPPLSISDVTSGAKSLVLIMDDPDAPSGTWAHWTVWSIDPKTSEIAENSVPSNSVEGITNFGTAGYGPPCPPSGTHRYVFKLYALDTTLTLTPQSTKEDLEKAVKAHVLDQTELIGLYGRK